MIGNLRVVRGREAEAVGLDGEVVGRIVVGRTGDTVPFLKMS